MPYLNKIDKSKTISVEEYLSFPEGEQDEWRAIYRKKKKKQRSYCECCGKYQGWEKVEIEYGEPIRYRPKRLSDITNDIFLKRMADAVFGGNVFVKRFKKNDSN